jgi:hypothetical protein
MAYTLTYNSASAVTTAAINSTKVTIFSNVACYANINGTATSSSTFPLVAANRKTDFNMQGLGNTLSLLPVAGTAAITVTQVGNVALSGVAINPTAAQANVAAW